MEPEEMVALLTERCPSLMGIRSLDHAFGGGKAPQVETFGGAFNGLLIDEVLVELDALPWDGGAVAQLVVNGEYEEGVHLITVHGKPGPE